jgi:hypothetical protein
MSSAVLERSVEQPKKLDLVAISPALEVAENKWSDPHPLLPVFVAGPFHFLRRQRFLAPFWPGWRFGIPA